MFHVMNLIYNIRTLYICQTIHTTMNLRVNNKLIKFKFENLKVEGSLVHRYPKIAKMMENNFLLIANYNQ